MTRGSPLVALAVMLAVTVALALPGAHPAQAAAPKAADCQIVLGFQAFRDALGHDTVGDCTENQHSTSFGAEQRTTGGLLVWHAATNRVSFTDGYHTWVSGPQGVQQRLNSELFDWERAEPDRAGARAGSAERPFRLGDWLSGYARAVRTGDAAGLESAYQHALTALQRSVHSLRTTTSAWLAAQLAAAMARGATPDSARPLVPDAMG